MWVHPELLQKSSCLSRAGSLPQQVSGMVRSISFSSQWEPLIWEKSPLYIPSEFCLSFESTPGERRNETWRQPQSAFGRRVLKMCSQWNTIPYSNHPQSHTRYEEMYCKSEHLDANTHFYRSYDQLSQPSSVPNGSSSSSSSNGPTKSTKGASKMRRDMINGEIANLRDLLPLPSSTRQRLSQLQLMALVCVYVRKSNYFDQGMWQSRGILFISFKNAK